jgi:hypothetical protein
VPESISLPRTRCENMFTGRPAGNYDRRLDFRRAVIAHLFSVPSATFLDAVSEGEPAVAGSAAPPSALEPSPCIPRCTKLRLASVPLKEISDMSNLHRELAPMSVRHVLR